jgi:hypothetical protein
MEEIPMSRLNGRIKMLEMMLESGELLEVIKDWQYREYANFAKAAGSHKEKPRNSESLSVPNNT